MDSRARLQASASLPRLLDSRATTLGERHGQTECTAVIGKCAAILPVRPGGAGRAIPGHGVAILDAQGRPCAPGETGEIVVPAPDPVMCLGSWNRPDKTAEEPAPGLLRTGDEARMDEQGYVHFSSRVDDVITSSGYRIGPSGIEDCPTGHPDVMLAAVVGVPDSSRTGLAEALAARVRSLVPPHLAPREVAFVGALPMTATGKIQGPMPRNGETSS